MIGSFEIGTFLGIKVRVHWMFVVLLPLALLYFPGPPAMTLAGIVLLFGVVFLHELGHSLVARHYGIRVLDITFWPLGGMARMTEIPEDSKVEGLIALAGPAVNFALAFITAPVFFWSQMAAGESHSQALQLVLDISGWFLAINLALGTFNLLPAFPMDGGRVLRAFLGRKGDWLRATERAVGVGKIFAVLMFLAALLLDGGLILGLIGVFVWFAGSRELLGVRMRHAREAAGPGGTGFQGLGGLADMFDAARRAQAEAAGTSARDAQYDIHPDDREPAAQRPSIVQDTGVAQGGLSDEDVARLESYRGRLKRFDRDE